MNTKAILRKVKRDYAVISKEFDVTRSMPWPEFEVFLKFMKKYFNKKASSKLRLLDVGCGNGRLAQFLREENIHYTGLDNNRNLLALAKKKNPEGKFRFGDMLALPFASCVFDGVWCIAALHHLPTPSLQKKALTEMRRVLKKNGLALFTVWNLWQPKYKKYIDKKTEHAWIPWGNPPKTKRFYYAFREKELNELLIDSGFIFVKKGKTDRNINFICRKA